MNPPSSAKAIKVVNGIMTVVLRAILYFIILPILTGLTVQWINLMSFWEGIVAYAIVLPIAMYLLHLNRKEDAKHAERV